MRYVAIALLAIISATLVAWINHLPNGQLLVLGAAVGALYGALALRACALIERGIAWLDAAMETLRDYVALQRSQHRHLSNVHRAMGLTPFRRKAS